MHGPRLRAAGVAALLAATCAPPAALAAARGDVELVALVEQFTLAQQRYDPVRLVQLMTADYLEVSPIGEVDRRAAVLGFYAPANRSEAPTMRLSEPVVRRYGPTASVVTTLNFDRPGPDGRSRTVSMRASYLAVREGRGWKLASAHYTPVAPPRPAPGSPGSR